MKKLLFFLLIFAGINCQAQTSIYFEDALKDSETIRSLNIKCDILTGLTNQLIKEIQLLKTQNPFLDNLLGYQKECYNDSTVISAHIEQIDNGTLAYITREVPSHYIHKEPTFEGFIKYIKQLKETDK